MENWTCAYAAHRWEADGARVWSIDEALGRRHLIAQTIDVATAEYIAEQHNMKLEGSRG